LTIYDVYREPLQKDINKAMFVLVQADEATDISNKTQLLIVPHFVHGSKVVEHFHGFVQLNDKSAVGISTLELYKLKNKWLPRLMMVLPLCGVQKMEFRN
jgi:dTDP-4-dehydrorhamnose 3,5-epimerase-like enzyme